MDILNNHSKETQDVDDFLARVDEISKQVEDIKNGKMDDDFEVDKEEMKRNMDEFLNKQKIAQMSSEDREKMRLEAIEKLEKEKAANALKRKEEEREKWWRGASFYNGIDEEKEEREAKQRQEEEEKHAKLSAFKKDRLDYSKWDKFVVNPTDPESLLEKKRAEQEAAKKQDEEFEKRNSEFCQGVKQDFEKRTEDTRTKERKALDLKEEGNEYFKAKKFDRAVESYMAALKHTPYDQAILTNIANAYLRMKSYLDVEEFCNRALHLNPNNIKALSRRAACKNCTDDVEGALKDLDAALAVDPSNIDIQKERTKIFDFYTLMQKEKELLAKTEGNLTKGGFHSLSSIDAMIKSLDVKELVEPGLIGLLNMVQDSNDNRIYFNSKGGITKLCDMAINDFTSNHTHVMIKIFTLCITKNPIITSKIIDSGVLTHCVSFLNSLSSLSGVLTNSVLQFFSSLLQQAPVLARKLFVADIKLLKRILVMLRGKVDGDISSTCCSFFDDLLKDEVGIKTLATISSNLDLFLIFTTAARNYTTSGGTDVYTIEAFSTLLASLSLHKDLHPSPSSSTSVVTQLANMVLQASATETCKSNSLACICNIANNDELLRALHESKLIPSILSSLPTVTSPLLKSRAVSVIARSLRFKLTALEIRDNSTTLLSLLSQLNESVAQGNDDVRDKYVLIFASLLVHEDKGFKECVNMIRDNNGDKIFVKILNQVAHLGSKSPKVCGNVLKVLISFLKDQDDHAMKAIAEKMDKYNVVNGVIEVIKSSQDGPVRKNASILIARLGKSEKVMSKIRDQRGMEMLLSMSSKLI